MTPVRIAAVGDKTIRFYLSPLDGPDFPWVSFSDSSLILFPSPEYRAELEERWESIYPHLTRRADDDSMVVPDFCIRGMFQWCSDGGVERAAALFRVYEETAAEVLVSLYCNLPQSVFTDFVRKASLRNNPLEMVGYAH